VSRKKKKMKISLIKKKRSFSYGFEEEKNEDFFD